MPSRLSRASRKPDRQLQIFALGGDGILAELGDLDPVGDLALVLPGALGQLVVFAAGLLDLVVDGSVTEALPAGVVARDGIENVFTQWHRK